MMLRSRPRISARDHHGAARPNNIGMSSCEHDPPRPQPRRRKLTQKETDRALPGPMPAGTEKV
eukprot:CAMPEP_0168417300 /NCGR_PEP_ID=MMETSP0228-20121227/31183_1 /TAXON_ID=133427 /ORGANISM="Protoceratium reticulatum, Strain CCCM 535 (=CCMP 1889)" /LENGTH=62 /DNA_ID=CAMNT_0008431149 /DNA_START=79 /DNA_END=263 /DNA_ORIENTATION=+